MKNAAFAAVELRHTHHRITLITKTAPQNPLLSIRKSNPSLRPLFNFRIKLKQKSTYAPPKKINNKMFQRNRFDYTPDSCSSSDEHLRRNINGFSVITLHCFFLYCLLKSPCNALAFPCVYCCIIVCIAFLSFVCNFLPSTNKHIEKHTVFRSIDTLFMLIWTSVTMAMRDEVG